MKSGTFEPSWLEVKLNSAAIKQKAKHLQEIAKSYDDQSKIRDLLLAVSCIDLTTLSGDDTCSNVSRLCWRAINPLSRPVVEKLTELGWNASLANDTNTSTKTSTKTITKTITTTGAVCVYPLRVKDCKHYLNGLESTLPIASVVSGFAAGQASEASVLSDIELAAKTGATEIDIVINRTQVLTGQWQQLYDHIGTVVLLCDQLKVHLKVILSVGELASLDNVYKASMCAMMAGAHFIKTSTGKESINAKLVFGLVMCRAIRDFAHRTGIKVGLKPAGGLKDGYDALCWVTLMRTQLGSQWLTNSRFRIGASSMLANIEAELFALIYHTKHSQGQLSF